MKNVIEAVLGANSILDRISSIAVPTIVAGGSEDNALPISASQEIQCKISNSTFVEIPACGHSSSIEQPEAITQLLEQLWLLLSIA
jgi:3-oxoadipate enol-lactonase